MKLTTICECGREEVSRVYGYRVGESYETPGLCADCQERNERKARAEAWAERNLR